MNVMATFATIALCLNNLRTSAFVSHNLLAETGTLSSMIEQNGVNTIYLQSVRQSAEEENFEHIGL
jgi:hypothetical protein